MREREERYGMEPSLPRVYLLLKPIPRKEEVLEVIGSSGRYQEVLEGVEDSGSF